MHQTVGIVRPRFRPVSIEDQPPGLRNRDPAALRKVRLARQDGNMDRLNETAQD